MTLKRWHWEWGGRGGVAAGLISAIILTYLFRDLGALFGIPVAAFLVYRVVREWPKQTRQDRLLRRWVIVGIICVAVVLEVVFPIRSLGATYRLVEETGRAKKIVGNLIESGNRINGFWTQGFNTQNDAMRKSAEAQINEWRKNAAADLSKCPFQENVWVHDVKTQAGNLILLEVVRLHTIRDHLNDFLEPHCFSLWRRSKI
jgi:hypothetical protein